MRKVDKFQGIRKVALAIGYDNGVINREFQEPDYLLAVEAVLGAEGVYEDELTVLDTWINTLTPEEVETLACGEEDDMRALEQRCPEPMLCGIFLSIFEEC